MRRLVQSLISFCILFSHNQSKNIPSRWMHVAFTWSRDRREGILYIDGIIEGSLRVSNGPLDRTKNNHTVFDIGLKWDSMHPMVKLNRLRLPFDALQQLSAKIK